MCTLLEKMLQLKSGGVFCPKGKVGFSARKTEPEQRKALWSAELAKIADGGVTKAMLEDRPSAATETTAGGDRAAYQGRAHGRILAHKCRVDATSCSYSGKFRHKTQLGNNAST